MAMRTIKILNIAFTIVASVALTACGGGSSSSSSSSSNSNSNNGTTPTPLLGKNVPLQEYTYSSDGSSSVIGGFKFIYDSEGQLTHKLGSAGAGTDGQWFTADDQYAFCVVQTYSNSKELIRETIYRRGSDNACFTPDDTVAVYTSHTYDANDQRVMSSAFYAPGADGVWFTSDDLPTSLKYFITPSTIGFPSTEYEKYEYDSNSRLARKIVLNGSGADGKWFTSDDVILNYRSYNYDPAGHVTSVKFYNSGQDGVWFNSDDYNYYETINSYDPYGHMTSSYDWEYAVQQTGSLTLYSGHTEYNYDPYYNLVREVYYSLSGPIDGHTTHYYDTSSNLTKTVHYYDPGTDLSWFTSDDRKLVETIYGII